MNCRGPASPIPTRSRLNASDPSSPMIERSPLCPPAPAALAEPQLAERQREVVDDDQHLGQRRALPREHLAHGDARLVHVRLRLDERAGRGPGTGRRRSTTRRASGPARPAGPIREPVQHHPADVVPRLPVLLARIPEPDDDLHGAMATSLRPPGAQIPPEHGTAPGRRPRARPAMVPAVGVTTPGRCASHPCPTRGRTSYRGGRKQGPCAATGSDVHPRSDPAASGGPGAALVVLAIASLIGACARPTPTTSPASPRRPGQVAAPDGSPGTTSPDRSPATPRHHPTAHDPGDRLDPADISAPARGRTSDRHPIGSGRGRPRTAFVLRPRRHPVTDLAATSSRLRRSAPRPFASVTGTKAQLRPATPAPAPGQAYQFELRRANGTTRAAELRAVQAAAPPTIASTLPDGDATGVPRDTRHRDHLRRTGHRRP